MSAGSRSAFFFQLFLILAAVSGWAAFAGTYLRLLGAEHELAAAHDQNDQMRESSQALFYQQAGLIRVLHDKNQQLQEKVQTYEWRLRQLGIIQ